ncbi:CHAT domain-containing protein [Brasilonema sp. UFV-L1]|uniref:CHAT domain-containing protein n=1 Tax=Brasilonema sp. UFV-L1 TaxID=2234130 RepID=UPI002006E09F|nr:CHAT domain-containing protein [Brasilonema sp. UFV-L1]
MQQKILILAANPKGTTPLRLDEEVREIDAGLKRALHRDQFFLEQKWAVRPRDIQRAMLDINPQIIHFSGHGTGDEGLVFEDETGSAKLVDGEALAGLFELFAEQIECVVLNGCYSEVQANAIAQHINYVIGMSKAIGDRAAIEFAVGFYDALGAGKPVEFAYKFGCAAIRLAGIPEQLTPTLKKKPLNGSKDQPQISGIYQDVLGREPTDSEGKYYVDLLEKGEKLNSIRDWITKTSSLLQDGNIISLECLGNLHTGFKFLDSRIKNNNVSLASNIDAHTKWKVHVINDEVVALENQGVINGSKWLDGITHNDSVNLAPNTEGGYTGTKWRINIIGDGEVALDNQGESRWLNGLTENGSVNLAPRIGNDHTGTRWKIFKH